MLQGWDETNDPGLAEFASRIQAWLFFGLISAYIADNVGRCRFLSMSEDGLPTVSLEKVAAFLQRESNTPHMRDAASTYTTLELQQRRAVA